MEDKEFYYRYLDKKVPYGIDEDGDLMGPFFTEIYKVQYEVVKHTPKGVKLKTYNGERLVLHASRKKFACATEEEALHSYIHRKRRQVSILQSKLSGAERGIVLAERRLGRLDPSPKESKKADHYDDIL